MRLIQPREIRKNFNFCSDSLAETPVLSYIFPSPLLHPPPLSSLSFPLFLKDIFNKESRPRSRLIRWFSERQIPTASAGFEGHPSIPLVFLLPSSPTTLPILHMPLLEPSLRLSLRPSILPSSRKKEKERNQLLLFQRANDADRDLKAAFSAEEKRPDCLKRARRKTRLSRSSSSCSFSYIEEGRRSFLRLRVDATEMYPRRREREKHSLNHSSRFRETHLSAKLRQEIPAFISLLDIHVSRLCTRVLPEILDVRQLYVIIFVPS